MATRSNGRVSADAASVGLGEVIEFMRLLWAVDHGLEASSKQMDALFGVTGPQRLVIRIVGRHPGIAAGRVAEILHVHPSTLTGVLQRLEKQGLLRKRLDPRDGRRILLTLTDEGHSLAAVSAGTVEQTIERALERVPEERLAAAREVLKAITASLDQAAPPGRSPRATRNTP